MLRLCCWASVALMSTDNMCQHLHLHDWHMTVHLYPCIHNDVMNYSLSSFGDTLWHSSMYPTGCLILYSRTCVALHMRHHPQQMIMVSSRTIQWRYGFFSDLLVWRIGLRKVKIFWSMVYYSTICPRLLDRRDRILYRLHIIPHGYVHPLFINVNNLSTLYFWFQFHMRRSCMMLFPEFHMCEHILSTC